MSRIFISEVLSSYCILNGHLRNPKSEGTVCTRTVYGVGPEVGPAWYQSFQKSEQSLEFVLEYMRLYMEDGQFNSWKMGQLTCNTGRKHFTDSRRVEIYTHDSSAGNITMALLQH